MKGVDKIYVIVKDKEGNFHQAHMTPANSYYVNGLVKYYPNNNFTKECVKDLKKITNQI